MISLSKKTYTNAGDELGSGSFGYVSTVTRNDGEKFAFKKFKVDFYGKKMFLTSEVLREISLMTLLNNTHDNIIGLEDIIINTSDEEKPILGIVMKKYDCDLYSAVVDDSLDLAEKMFIAQKILEAVSYIHDNGIIHRDITLCNIFLDEYRNPVLADFSLGKVLQNDYFCVENSTIGTWLYRAPELETNDFYGFSVDAWSIGILFYEMFIDKEIVECENYSDSLELLLEDLTKLTDLPHEYMIKKLLVVDPEIRWTPRQILESQIFSYKINDIPLVITTLTKCKVSKTVKEMCRKAKHDDTAIAAQIYINKTGCSAITAVYLAYKIYEPNGVSDLMYKYSNIVSEKEELYVFKKMGCNLYV